MDQEATRVNRVQIARQAIAAILKKARQNVDWLPEKGVSFVESCEQTLAGISTWIDEHDNITDKQLHTVRNVSNGLDRWVGR